jgi:hypothetical protein
LLWRELAVLVDQMRGSVFVALQAPVHRQRVGMPLPRVAATADQKVVHGFVSIMSVVTGTARLYKRGCGRRFPNSSYRFHLGPRLSPVGGADAIPSDRYPHQPVGRPGCWRRVTNDRFLA